MKQFQNLLPAGKQVTCLEDLSSLRVRDLNKILSVYKEKLSGVKADLVLRFYAVFVASVVRSMPLSLKKLL